MRPPLRETQQAGQLKKNVADILGGMLFCRLYENQQIDLRLSFISHFSPDCPHNNDCRLRVDKAVRQSMQECPKHR